MPGGACVYRIWRSNRVTGCSVFSACAPTFEFNPLKKQLLGARDGRVVIACKPRAAPRPRFTWTKGKELLFNNSRSVSPLYRSAHCWLRLQRSSSRLRRPLESPSCSMGVWRSSTPPRTTRASTRASPRTTGGRPTAPVTSPSQVSLDVPAHSYTHFEIALRLTAELLSPQRPPASQRCPKTLR